MLVVIPLMCILHHRSDCDEGEAAPKWWTMIPLFVVGFALMSLLRTVGDTGDAAFGFIYQALWFDIVSVTKHTAEWCLAIAMAAVGLGTSIRDLLSIGLKPLALGQVAALLVGVASGSMVALLYQISPRFANGGTQTANGRNAADKPMTGGPRWQSLSPVRSR